jgi:hypothetical protein
MRLIAVILSVVILVACNNKRAPKGIMEPEPMQAVLWDMFMAGEFLQGYVLLQDTGINKLVKSDQVYNKVLALHKIDRETFDKSMNWYRQHPQMMKEVLDSIAAQNKEKSDQQPLPAVPATDTGAVPDTGISKTSKRELQQGVQPMPPPPPR